MTQTLCERCLNFRRAELNERVDKCLRKLFILDSPDKETPNAADEYRDNCQGRFFVPEEMGAIFD
jgi:hypothetical protein